MSKKTASYLIALVLALSFIKGVPDVSGGQASVQKKKWREAFVSVKRGVMSVEAIEGKTIGVMEQRGFAFFQDGEVATVTAWFRFDGQRANCEYDGYLLYTFEDGATQTARFEGHGNPVGSQQGSFTFLQGSGRFKGIQGKGTFTAKGFPPDADLYVEAEAEYTISNE